MKGLKAIFSATSAANALAAIISGCGTQQATPSSAKPSNSTTATTTASASSPQSTDSQAPQAFMNLTITGSGVELGSDGKTHDAFLPGNFTFIKDKPVVLQVANYDEGPHTFTVPDLNVNFTIPGHKADNLASVTTFTFTPSKAGTFKWMCEYPCDGKANGWAMTQPGYMQGQVTIQ